MEFPFRIVTGRTIQSLLDGRLEECVGVVRAAYLAHGAGHSVNPNSHFLRFPEKPSARIIALPAYLGDQFDVSGIKWIASYPENVAKGFPRASAVLILNDYETGYPFACLESSIISASRTAASAALAASEIVREREAKVLGIVGTGLIARYVVRFLRGTGWKFGSIVLHDLNASDAERFRSNVLGGSDAPRVELASSADEVVRRSDLVVLTTTAPTPHLKDPSAFRHNPVVLHLSLRDIAPEIILASHNVVDDVGHVMNANTSVHLAEQATKSRAFVAGTLPELIEGKFSLDRSKPTIFSPFGLGVLDLALGKWLHDLAVKAGRAVEVADFFSELVR